MRAIGEFDFIERIQRGCVVRPEGVVKAIGDDAAAFRPPADSLVLLSTDLLVEGIHFRRDRIGAEDLGYKALAVNLSDIAAMGGEAREAFVSIAVPGSCSIGYLEDMYRGMKTLAAEFHVNILGGDTTASPRDLVISISVVGAAASSRMLQRSAAVQGDRILSTGTLGDSRAGLLLLVEDTESGNPEWAELIRAHLRPRPHLPEGRFLAAREGVHAGIDISDGLAQDIGHIARESRVGVRLFYDRLPLSSDFKRFCRHRKADPVEFALTGGEDYILVVTADPERAGEIAAEFGERFGSPLYDIGEITDPGTMEIVYPDGTMRKLAAKGWDHFRNEAGPPV